LFSAVHDQLASLDREKQQVMWCFSAAAGLLV